jgi:hypothetical protein
VCELLADTGEDQLELNRVQVDCNKFLALQQNAVQVKDKASILLRPLIITVKIDGHLA